MLNILDKEFLKEFLERSGDTHNMFAWIVFRKECIECGCCSYTCPAKRNIVQYVKYLKAQNLSITKNRQAY